MSDEPDDLPKARRPRRRGNSSVPCPECGSRSLRSGPWPWYLGTVGTFVCKAMICNECEHEFDLNKPQANLATRKRNLTIIINGIGLLGILFVFVGMFFYLRWIMAN